MVFSSSFFLFFYLPITLALAFLTKNSKYKNLVLLILSVFFYILGEGELVLLMFGSITLNYFLGKWVGNSSKKTAIIVGVIINLLILVIYKYSSFLIDNINILLSSANISTIPKVKIKLPAGISFYTFHSISYLIDVYRKDNKFQKSYVDMALYICLFPQLIAGPIIRYKDIAHQFVKRTFNSHYFQIGIQRFIIGLGKKVIIANSIGYNVDDAMGLSPELLSTPTAWLIIISYSLQLYFDFSGYSDMAIGLAKMLGFDFLENFNFPYIAKSIREFWQRWHISLSNWFRDYLYIPLGGNRVSNKRVYLNLFIVFFLTGLWHGASWNFVIWGLIHGFFMIIERLGFSKILSKTGPFQHIYTLFIVALAWVFFRVESFEQAILFIKSLLGIGNTSQFSLNTFLDREHLIWLIVAIILAANGANWFLKKLMKSILKSDANNPTIKSSFRFIKNAFLIIVLYYSMLNIVIGSYNPFIYFRF